VARTLLVVLIGRKESGQIDPKPYPAASVA